MAVIPDWMREQQRVDALLGESANGYGSAGPYDEAEPGAEAGSGAPMSPLEYQAAVARATALGQPPPPPPVQYGPLGVPSPTASADGNSVVNDNSKYGYFDPQNAQANTDYSVAMQEALNRGDNAGYEQALSNYRANSGGLQPVWSYGINQQSVAANQYNPGGVSYGQPNPAVQYTLPGTVAPTAQNTVANGMYRDASGNLQGGTPEDQAAAARAAALRGAGDSTTISRNSGDRTTPVTPGPTSERINPAQPQGTTEATQPIRQPQAPTTPVTPRPPVGPVTTSPPIDSNPTPNPNGPVNRQPTTPTTPVTPRPPTGPATQQPTTPTTPTQPTTPTTPTTPTQPGSPYVPPAGPRVPLPNGSYTAQAFPNWATWNDGAPYLGGDPGMMATSESNRAVDYGNLFQNEFGNAYSDARSLEDSYRGTADNAYGDLYENPGYNSSESDLIQNGGLAGGLNSLRASQGELDQNYLTPAEQAAIRGNPQSIYDAFNPESLNDIARAGTGATKGFFDTNYTNAQDAVNSGQSRADGILGTYGTGARGALSTMRSDLTGAIDPTKLGVSEAQVARQIDSAGRGVGAQYEAAIDQLQRQAEAAGNVSPLALAAGRERLLRAQSVAQQNAMTDAEIRIRESQRAAEQDISNRRIQTGTTLGNAGIGLEGDLANTGLNSNQSLAALRAGTEATYGGLGTSLGLNTTKQLTDTAKAAGDTRLGQAEYVDQNNSSRAATVAQNRQATSVGNANTRFNQGLSVANANSANAKTIGDARQAGQQAARNYWAGAGQYQGGQANAAAGQQLTGAQTSLSGQGQAGSTAVGNLNARRNPIQIGGIGFTL